MVLLKVTLIVFILGITLIEGEALQCYKCRDEPETSDCAKGVVSAMKILDCPGGSEAECFQHDIDMGGRRKYRRGCTMSTGIPEKNLCTELEQMAEEFPVPITIYSCSTCQGELCNI